MLYQEVRNASSVGAYTASTLACRKLLMNVAVALGAALNQSFVAYVDFLVEQGHVTPSSRTWVDKIRSKGNEATHEIALMTRVDATELIDFTEMLLKLVYEYPHRGQG